MNQHFIQKAYLKRFADQSGRVLVYSKTGSQPVPRSPAQCAAEEDFQSPELEFFQNQVIETPGIEALRGDGLLSEEEFEQMSMWMGLHIIRTQKSREDLFKSSADYENCFREELRKERLFADYYRKEIARLTKEAEQGGYKELDLSKQPVIAKDLRQKASAQVV